MSNKLKWKPVFARVKVRTQIETLSDIIEISDTYLNDIYVRGFVVDVGPLAGYDDHKLFHELNVGQEIIYNKGHIIKYESADKQLHEFIPDTSIVAILS